MNPYLAPGYVRVLLRSLNLRPTRGMGQHFLTDPRALSQIVDAAAIAPDDIIVEVGPGLGVLTWELLQRTNRVVAVELDKRLAAHLRQSFNQEHAPLQIIQADVLNLSVSDILPHIAPSDAAASTAFSKYKVVANLPYAITSPVLFHFLESVPAPVLMVVLVQSEVAERITATPGKMSVLAHAIQMQAHPYIIGRISAKSFVPPPAVDSAILGLHIRATKAVEVDDEKALLRVIKAGFLHRRKKLSNALPSGLAAMGTRRDRETVIEAMEAAGVSPDRRAETLSIVEWLAVYNTLSDHPEE